VARIDQLTPAERQIVENAIASARLEGHEPSPEAVDLMSEVAAGRLDGDAAVAELVAIATSGSLRHPA
jgi:hypothetical protein